MKVIEENLPPFYARECSVAAAAFKNFLKNTFVPNSAARSHQPEIAKYNLAFLPCQPRRERERALAPAPARSLIHFKAHPGIARITHARN